MAAAYQAATKVSRLLCVTPWRIRHSLTKHQAPRASESVQSSGEVHRPVGMTVEKRVRYSGDYWANA